MRSSCALAIPLLALLALLVACGSDAGGGAASVTSGSNAAATPTSPGPSSTVTVTTAPTNAPKNAPTTEPTTDRATSSAGVATSTSSLPEADGTGDCTNAQLTVGSKALSGGDSHGGIVVTFTNTGTSGCSLHGYPGAAAVDRAGHQFAQAKRTLDGYLAGCGCTSPDRVRLAPGKSASSVVEGDNGGGEECLRGHTVLVTPPNTTRAVHLPYLDAYSCDFQVHPVIAGTGAGNRH